MLLLCHLSLSNWWHYCPCVLWNHWSPVDSRCKGSLDLNFGGPVCGDSIVGGFLSQKLGLMFSFIFALTSCLTNNIVARRNTRPRMRCHCYVSFVNPTFCMVEQQDNYAVIILKVLTGRIKYKQHRFDLRDKEITCDHGCVELDFKHGR